jgi:hypothetical protein
MLKKANKLQAKLNIAQRELKDLAKAMEEKNVDHNAYLKSLKPEERKRQENKHVTHDPTSDVKKGTPPGTGDSADEKAHLDDWKVGLNREWERKLNKDVEERAELRAKQMLEERESRMGAKLTAYFDRLDTENPPLMKNRMEVLKALAKQEIIDEDMQSEDYVQASSRSTPVAQPISKPGSLKGSKGSSG